MQAFFFIIFIFFVCVCHSSRPCSQAFLAEAVETWDKKRDEFHYMQVSLIITWGVGGGGGEGGGF